MQTSPTSPVKMTIGRQIVVFCLLLFMLFSFIYFFIFLFCFLLHLCCFFFFFFFYVCFFLLFIIASSSSPFFFFSFLMAFLLSLFFFFFFFCFCGLPFVETNSGSDKGPPFNPWHGLDRGPLPDPGLGPFLCKHDGNQLRQRQQQMLETYIFSCLSS